MSKNNVKNFPDSFLKQYSETVLTTSINLFFATALELYIRESIYSAPLKLALMDSFRIQARCLLFFFYSNNTKPDDAKAQDYMKEDVVWANVRIEQTPALIDLQRRVGKEVAHLTYSRPYDPLIVVDWDIGKELGDLYLVLENFIKYADSSKLHSHVIGAPASWYKEFSRFDTL